MFRLTSKGDLPKLNRFFERMRKHSYMDSLDRFGNEGVKALRTATPKDTGTTASSWGYRIVKMGPKARIEWYNTNINDGVVIAVLLQYGHGTGTGGYVYGIDYINPAMRRVYQGVIEQVWKEVTSA